MNVQRLIAMVAEELRIDAEDIHPDDSLTDLWTDIAEKGEIVRRLRDEFPEFDPTILDGAMQEIADALTPH